MNDPVEYLELNGFNASKIPNDVVDLVMWLTSANPGLEEISTRLSRLVTRRRRR